jgi:hypothetical protein
VYAIFSKKSGKSTINGQKYRTNGTEKRASSNTAKHAKTGLK